MVDIQREKGKEMYYIYEKRDNRRNVLLEKQRDRDGRKRKTRRMEVA